MKKLKFKKKLIIFDLDGVLIDSKLNMNLAWNSVRKKYNLTYSFQKYFYHVGKPFEKILENLGILENHLNIKREYEKSSIKNFNKIKLYKGVKKTLKFLKEENIKTAIVTSKNLKRTKLILKKFDINVNFIQCPSKSLRGKPFPDQILNTIKKFRFKKKFCAYIGDTKFDKLASERSKIDFIFASYGYKIGIKRFKNQIKSIFQVTDFI